LRWALTAPMHDLFRRAARRYRNGGLPLGESELELTGEKIREAMRHAAQAVCPQADQRRAGFPYDANVVLSNRSATSLECHFERTRRIAAPCNRVRPQAEKLHSVQHDI
jgi:hypothetical protein